jgi:hypothetical protein
MGPARVSGKFVVWSEGRDVRALDLRYGKPFVIGAGWGGYDVSGRTAAVVLGEGTEASIHLYDLVARKGYAQPVTLPAGFPAGSVTGSPRLSEDLVVFDVLDVSTGLHAVCGARYDRASRTVGHPFRMSGAGSALFPDVSGSLAVWLQTGESGGVHAALLDLLVDPPQTSETPLATPTADDAVFPAISGRLAVWGGTVAEAPVVEGALCDAVAGTWSPSFVIDSSLAPVEPDVSGDLVVFSGSTSPVAAARVYGALVTESGGTIAVGTPFLIGGRDVRLPAVADDVAVWLERRDGLYSKRAALLDPERPSSRAPTAARVRKGAAMTLKYRIDDRLWRAKVTLVVKNRRGQVVLALRKGWRPTNKLDSARTICRLPRGVYRFYVKATNMAGKSVARPASNRLKVL